MPSTSTRFQSTNSPTTDENTLSYFLEPTRIWFKKALGKPTPPQAQGWPAIQHGQNTLILAPTGSGKTLSAFLWGIDQIFREGGAHELGPKDRESRKPVVLNPTSKSSAQSVTQDYHLHILYISPLKALNNDVERNLRLPLAGIRKTAAELGMTLPEINVGVRSGDTPSRERQAMLRKPPHILITTPESLYLMLTGPKSREIFSTVRTVIVDEIHTLAGSKRGVHLAISLERLQRIAQQPIQRIGLSATIRPLDEIARYLGGCDRLEGSDAGSGDNIQSTDSSLEPQFRDVTIIDAAYKKEFDLLVETVASDFNNLPGDSIWPTIIPRTVELMNDHKSTLIFVNNRRLAERTADRLNEQIAAETEGRENALLEDGLAKGLGMMAAGMGQADALIRAHHGSVSKEVRLQLEKELKAGELPAIVGTASLELGIDIGSIDLVVHYHSPKTVAEGLQRIGRSGHLVGQIPKGRIFPTHREDIMEAAAVAGGMLRGDIEPTYTPRNPLDILAQQIVSIVSVEDWNVDELFHLIRQSYPYRDLTLRVYYAVLDMLTGRFPSDVHKNLRARLVWDRVNNQIAALPGTRLLATTNGGAITDKGSFGAFLSDGKTKLGELDEEFVYETRVGDTFMLGSQVWRVTEITDAKVLVTDAAGATPRMPFWRGDFAWRPYDLGERVGAFRRNVADKLTQVMAQLDVQSYRSILQMRSEEPVVEILSWLQHNYALDFNSAYHVIDYVAGQLDHAGAISSDKTILVEVFEDAIGDPRMVIQAPFGGRVNGLWALAIGGALRDRTGVDVEIQTNDEGILFRFPDADADFPLDIITEMTPVEARKYILQELPDSPVFGAQFRQNAARALLLPGLGVGKRTPFWLQRLRAKDLLQVVRQLEDFPIVAETYRDCLEEIMDLPSLEKILAAIQNRTIQVVPLESLSPSPVANSLLWHFIDFYMYEWDAPKTERQLQTASLNHDLLQDLLTDVNLSEVLRPEAVEAIHARLQHVTPETQARTIEELALLFQRLGDLSASEIAERTTIDPSGWIGQLAGTQRIVEMAIPTATGPQERWIHAEYGHEYASAFLSSPTMPDVADASLTNTQESSAHDNQSLPVEEKAAMGADAPGQAILDRYLSHAGPTSREAILARYSFPPDWLDTELERRIARRDLVHGHFGPTSEPSQTPPESNESSAQSTPTRPFTKEALQRNAQLLDRRTLEQIHRRTLTILRNEVRAVSFTAYVGFLTHWQHLHPHSRLDSAEGLQKVLQKLRAAPIIGLTWERDVLPLRITNFKSTELAELCQRGDLVWVGAGGADPRRGRIRFFYRGEGRAFLEEPEIRPLDDIADCEEDVKNREAYADHAAEDSQTLSTQSRSVFEFLKSEGSIVSVDLQTGLDLNPEEAEAALMELAMAGLVTADNLTILHNRLPRRSLQASASARTSSSLEAELASRLAERRGGQRLRRSGRSTHSGLQRPGRSEFRAAKRRVDERLARKNFSSAPNLSSGEPTPARALPSRWTLVHRIGLLGKELTQSEKVSRQVRQLFARYGVITRKSLDRELGAWNWPSIYQELQRLEMRGEVRRGYFVQGLPGVQFALPDVVEQLRELAVAEKVATKNFVVLNACDPANVFFMYEGGDLLPLSQRGETLRLVRVPSNWLVLDDGLLTLLIEENGGAITTIQGIDDLITEQALRAWFEHAVTFSKRIVVKTWNDVSIINSVGQPILESLGFYREYPTMIWTA